MVEERRKKNSARLWTKASWMQRRGMQLINFIFCLLRLSLLDCDFYLNLNMFKWIFEGAIVVIFHLSQQLPLQDLDVR